MGFPVDDDNVPDDNEPAPENVTDGSEEYNGLLSEHHQARKDDICVDKAVVSRGLAPSIRNIDEMKKSTPMEVFMLFFGGPSIRNHNAISTGFPGSFEQNTVIWFLC